MNRARGIETWPGPGPRASLRVQSTLFTIKFKPEIKEKVNPKSFMFNAKSVETKTFFLTTKIRLARRGSQNFCHDFIYRSQKQSNPESPN